MRPAELREVDLEALLEHELAVGAEVQLLHPPGRVLLVPLREQRARDVHPLAVPGLRDHVRLRPEGDRLDESRLGRIGHVVALELAGHEAGHEEPLVVGGEADVDGQDLADVGHLLRSEGPVRLSLDEDHLVTESGRRDRPVVLRRRCPADLEGRTAHTEGLQRLHRVEVPEDHAVAELLHELRGREHLGELGHVDVLAGE
jgi:hypothetical protein